MTERGSRTWHTCAVVSPDADSSLEPSGEKDRLVTNTPCTHTTRAIFARLPAWKTITSPCAAPHSVIN
eukprot:1196174-Prorocentrum_minimum.AAC.4